MVDRVVWRRPETLDAPWLDVITTANAEGRLNAGELVGKLRAMDTAQERCDRLADQIRAVGVLLRHEGEESESRFADALRRKLDEAVGEFNEISRYLRSVYS